MASISTRILKVPGPGRVTLHAIADFQYGSKSCDKALLKRKIDDIVKCPTGGMSVILGDITDDDRPTTRTMRKAAFASRPEVLFNDARNQKLVIDKEVIPLLLPLAKTKHGIVGALAGHHWSYVLVETPTEKTLVNSAKYICHELGRLTGRLVPYLGVMSSWIELDFHTSGGNVVSTLGHIQHGTGGGQTLASALNKLEMTARWAKADFLIRAHDCKLVAAKTVRLGPRATRGGVRVRSAGARSLKATPIALLNIGSMTRGYLLDEEEPDYVEMEMMRPVAMGWGKIHFDIRRASRTEDPNASFIADLAVEI